jgi:hypothetical protein
LTTRSVSVTPSKCIGTRNFLREIGIVGNYADPEYAPDLAEVRVDSDIIVRSAASDPGIYRATESGASMRSSAVTEPRDIAPNIPLRPASVRASRRPSPEARAARLVERLHPPKRIRIDAAGEVIAEWGDDGPQSSRPVPVAQKSEWRL